MECKHFPNPCVWLVLVGCWYKSPQNKWFAVQCWYFHSVGLGWHWHDYSCKLLIQICLGQELFCCLVGEEERGVWGENPARNIFFGDLTTAALTWVFVAWAMPEWGLCTKSLLLRAWKVFVELFPSRCFQVLLLVSSGKSSLHYNGAHLVALYPQQQNLLSFHSAHVTTSKQSLEIATQFYCN